MNKTLLFQIKSVRHTCVKSQLSKTLRQLYDQRLSKIFPTTTYKRIFFWQDSEKKHNKKAQNEIITLQI